MGTLNQGYARGAVGLVSGRAVQAVVVALVVGIASFAMLQALPGDAAYRIAAARYGYDLVDAAAAQAGLLPVAGLGGVQHLLLPSLTLGLGLAAVSNRVIRDAVVDATNSDWHQFARTKGLSSRATALRHVARNAGLPVVAYVGVQLAYLLEGVVIVESVFAWPGIGHALVHAIFDRDVAMLQGTALTLGLLYVVLNLLVDVACRGIDPRRRA